MKKLHLAVWLAAGCCALSLSCDNGSSTTTTPAPAPPPPAPPPPPPAPEPPAVPMGLQVSAHGQDFIEWSWDAVEGADGYDVLFSLDEMIDLTDDIVSRAADETSYRREELPADSGATLRVRSASGMGDDRLTSEWSDHVPGMTLPPPPADVAGDWLFVYEASPPPSVEPTEGCFVTAYWLAARGTEPWAGFERVFRIEQDGANLTGHSWFIAEGQEPSEIDLATAQPGWRIAGNAEAEGLTLIGTHRWSGEEWWAYPYLAVDRPAESFANLGTECPEYSGQVLQTLAVSIGWETDLREDGSMSGTWTGVLEWKIGDLTWTETQATSFTATRLEGN